MRRDGYIYSSDRKNAENVFTKQFVVSKQTSQDSKGNKIITKHSGMQSITIYNPKADRQLYDIIVLYVVGTSLRIAGFTQNKNLIKKNLPFTRIKNGKVTEIEVEWEEDGTFYQYQIKSETVDLAYEVVNSNAYYVPISKGKEVLDYAYCAPYYDLPHYFSIEGSKCLSHYFYMVEGSYKGKSRSGNSRVVGVVDASYAPVIGCAWKEAEVDNWLGPHDIYPTLDDYLAISTEGSYVTRGDGPDPLDLEGRWETSVAKFSGLLAGGGYTCTKNNGSEWQSTGAGGTAYYPYPPVVDLGNGNYEITIRSDRVYLASNTTIGPAGYSHFEAEVTYSTVTVHVDSYFNIGKWNIIGHPNGRLKDVRIVGEVTRTNGVYTVTADIQKYADAIGCETHEIKGFYLME